MKFYTAVETYGKNILYAGYEDGKRFYTKVKFNPTFYVQCREEKRQFSTLDGKPLGAYVIGNMKETKEYIKIAPENLPLYGHEDFAVQFINNHYDTDNIQFDMKQINVATFDIEVKSDEGFPKPEQALQPITAITLKFSNDPVYYTWGYGDYEGPAEYKKCESEEDLLRSFLDVWSCNYPDIVTGWNSEQFDMVYVINRIIKLLGDKETARLSPWKIKPWLSTYMETRYIIYGVAQLDYMLLYKKLAREKRESYSLDYISHVELGEKKLDYSEYGSLHNLYTQNHQKFIDYNIRDVELVVRLDDKLTMIMTDISIAYLAGTTFDKTFGQRNKAALGSLAIWDAYIYNFMKKKGFIIPPKQAKISDSIVGGYVKEAEVGKHDWLCSFDLDGLYPHLIMQYNISPETILDSTVRGVTVDDLLKLKKYDILEGTCMSATGQLFDTTKRGMFPQIVDYLYNDVRRVAKSEMIEFKKEKETCKVESRKKELDKLISALDVKQNAVKTMMNALYGCMANEYFRFYDTRMAESITMSGQLSIRWAEKVVNTYLSKHYGEKDYVLAMDTDSLYIKLGDIVRDNDDPLDAIKTDIIPDLEKMIGKGYDGLAKYMHAYEQKMQMKLENIADSGVWTAKKRYVIQVLHSEGVDYKKPKLKIVGLESVRSSTPQIARKLIKHTLSLILNEPESVLHDFIKKAREKFKTLPVEDIASPRGINSLRKYKQGGTYGKKTPIHVRGSILYNNLLDANHLTNEYEYIHESDKIKFVYMKLPNPIRENVISFKNVLPVELGLHEYIDYDLQFQKTYLDSISLVLHPIGWNTEKVNTLEEFFT